ncbi:MAG: ankyrin repeat domain-containing protein [Longimicrobiales bacterium]
MRSGPGMRVAGALSMALLIAATFAPESPVADAAMRGDAEAVRVLINAGEDVNAPQGDGMTALHWAASHGDAEIARILIEAHANVAAVTRIGSHTPLHVASRSGSSAIVRALLDAGADANATTTNGVTPLHLAAMAGDPESVTALLDHGANANAGEPAFGQTPLMLAAAHDRVSAMKVLLARGADPAIAADGVNLVELAAADEVARRARDDAMDAFQAKAARPETWRPSPAQVAAAVDAARVMEKNPVGAGVAESEAQEGGGGGDEANPGFAAMVGVQGGLTALLLAVREGHIEAVRTLLDAGADINQPRLADLTSPLLLATINGHYDLALFLLERGADPNLASKAGATPLYGVINKEWAPSSRHPQPTYNLQQKVTYLGLMEALLKAGADPNARLEESLWYTTYDRDNLRVDFGGATAFWRAAYGTDVPAMKLLIAHGADPNIPTSKPAERRRRFGGEGGGRGRAGGAERVDPSGLPPVPVGGPGIPPIVAAAGAGYGRGYAANDHRHAPEAWLTTMKFLVEELDADANARDHEGFTAMHYAAARGDNEVIQYLVEKGADVTAVTRTGQTTVDMANGPVQRISPYLETVALLEKLGAKNNHRCVSC